LLVDIGRLDDLRYVREDGDRISIGALTRHAALVRDPVLAQHCALIGEAAALIGDPQVRHRGTIGGSVAHGDPASDLATILLTLDADFVARGSDGERTIPAAEFFTGPFETALARQEMLTEIRIPIRPGGGSAYEKVGRRVGDWPVAAAGVALWLAGDTIADAGIGLTAVGARHFAAAEAEEFLRGASASEENFAQAGQIAAEHCRPVSDQRGPAAYKRHLTAELTVRALRRAADRVRHEDA